MTDLWSGLLGSALALALVLALAWLVLLAVRRLSGPGAAAGSAATELRVLRVLNLGPRERLVLVQHGKAELLLGVGAAGVRLLHSQPDVAAAPPHAPAPPAEADGLAAGGR